MKILIEMITCIFVDENVHDEIYQLTQQVYENMKFLSGIFFDQQALMLFDFSDRLLFLLTSFFNHLADVLSCRFQLFLHQEIQHMNESDSSLEQDTRVAPLFCLKKNK